MAPKRQELLSLLSSGRSLKEAAYQMGMSYGGAKAMASRLRAELELTRPERLTTLIKRGELVAPVWTPEELTLG